MHATPLLVLFAIAGLVWFVVFPILGTTLKDKWGINLHRVSCPRCGTPMPVVRKPASMSQALLGGWTCPNCRCEVDKWGRNISPPAHDGPTGA